MGLLFIFVVTVGIPLWMLHTLITDPQASSAWGKSIVWVPILGLTAVWVFYVLPIFPDWIWVMLKLRLSGVVVACLFGATLLHALSIRKKRDDTS